MIDHNEIILTKTVAMPADLIQMEIFLEDGLSQMDVAGVF